MRHFRDVLYSSYSAGFGTQKRYDRELAFRMFEAAGRLPDLPKDAPIADVGCGKCEWLAWLRSHGFSAVRGFDLSAGELAHAGEIPVECGDVIETLAAEKWKGTFALIHAKDILEHFTKQETIDFLSACHGALREGGRLWIATFNAQAIFSTATRYGDFTHESGFTPSSLAQVLRANGFEIDEISGTHTCPATIKGRARAWIWRLASIPARTVLRARHGGAAEAGIDLFSVHPDLFAAARKAPVLRDR